MRIMYPDKITVLAADEENTHYPATNLQDGHTNNLWKATSKDAVVTLTVSAGASAVAVFNTNATSVKVATTNTSNDTTVTYDLTTSNEKNFWAEYSSTIIEHTVVLTFTAAAGEIVEAGVISAGTSILFADPKYGIREGLIGYSIIKKLKNGAFYLKDTNVVRTFSGRLTLDRDTDFYTFMLDTAKALGSNSFACRTSTTVTDWEWVVYVRFNGMPKGSHIYPDDSMIDFSLIESL